MPVETTSNRRKPDWMRALASYTIPILMAVAAVAVAQDRLQRAESDIVDLEKKVEKKVEVLESQHDELVTQQILDLTISPIQQQVESNGQALEDTKKAMDRVETNLYNILKALNVNGSNSNHTN